MVEPAPHFLEAELNEPKKAATAEKAEPAPAPALLNTRTTRNVVGDEGPIIRMRVTVKGHGEISEGGDFGFNRYPMGAEFECSEATARSLSAKGYAEPVGDQREVMKIVEAWTRRAREEARQEERRKRVFDNMIEYGVSGAGKVISDTDIWDAR